MNSMQSDRYHIQSTVLNTQVDFDRSGQNNLPDPESALLVTDDNLYRNYRDLIDDYRHICLPPGEDSKSSEQLVRLYNWFIEMQADRSATVIAFGGGVVCDIAAYAASTYMRGLPLVLVPTSLLAMADAAVGGKNGINFHGHKNIIGTIRQADRTIITAAFLKTLPELHYLNGLAEIAKIAMIMDEPLMNILERSANAILNRDVNVMDTVIHTAVRNKLTLVEADEQDKGQRHILNFGHTIGHALEMEDNVLHGFAVSKGMVAALSLSRKYGMPEQDYHKCISLLKALKLPVDFEMKDNYLHHMKLDKKRHHNDMRFVFLEAAGKARIETLNFEQFKSMMYAT